MPDMQSPMGGKQAAAAKTATLPSTLPQLDLPWYRVLNKRQWFTLLASNLGWLFDGYESYALILVMGIAFRQLLPPSDYRAIPLYFGLTIALTLLGWGIGGILGGICSDYLGRKRTMIYAILAYSLITGLTAAAWSLPSFIVLRFMVGLALGSEWATGSAMVAELWPDRHRGKGAGLMQCGLGIGFFCASAIWFFVSETGTHAWRYMFLIGVLPALATFWIRRGISEPEKWEAVDRKRREVREAVKRGQQLDEESKKLAKFTLHDLLSDRRYRWMTFAAFLIACTSTFTWWGVSSWVPPFVASIAGQQHLPALRWASIVGMTYNFGGVAGYVAFGFVADAWRRRPTIMLWFFLAWLTTPLLFLWTRNLNLILLIAAINGAFSLGQWTWCPTWLPEAYPTRFRATASALVFNAPRFIGFLGPLVAGTLITHFGGFGKAAMIVALFYFVGIVAALFFPETKGKPLPE